jgi:hypothetical protein
MAAICQLPCVFVFDNDDLRNPFCRVAIFEYGRWRGPQSGFTDGWMIWKNKGD